MAMSKRDYEGIAALIRKARGWILEIHPCRVCEEQTANPDGLCSKACREEVYNEERDSHDDDERHPDTLDDGDEEAGPDEEA